jgi:serine/threonine-protein kinase RsbW
VTRTMLVRHEPASASEVRRELALDLDLHGVCADAIDEVNLVASELIGNAVRHCGTSVSDPLGVNWTVGDDEILLSVEDDCSTMPVVREVGTESTSGRGLKIVGALASDWGVELTTRGKRVWVRMPTSSTA